MFKLVDVLVIDPFKQELRWDSYNDNGDPKQLTDIMGCDTIDVVKLGDNVIMFVDDNGLLYDNRYFSFKTLEKSQEEIAKLEEFDKPFKEYLATIKENGLASEEDIKAIQQRVKETVNESVKFATLMSSCVSTVMIFKLLLLEHPISINVTIKNLSFLVIFFIYFLLVSI